ncbi:MAG: DUF1592 domain-containing protein [Planctomycetota bacterium]|nr:DUF1592 domain-containing protein [Planctomycetota bacterium]
MPLLGGIAWCAPASLATEADDEASEAKARAEAGNMRNYKSQIATLFRTYCMSCHGEEKPKGGLRLKKPLENPFPPYHAGIWKKVAAKVKSQEMPPDDAKQPSDEQRKQITDWVEGLKCLIPKDPGLFVIRRLSKVEYGNTLHDLFGVDPQVAHDLPDEVFGAGYTNTLSPSMMEQYLQVANEVLEKCLGPSGASGSPPSEVELRLFGPAPSKKADAKEAARKTARSLARLAYRRPPTDAEVDLLVRVFTLASDQGKSHRDSLRLMLKAVLVSPQFLFITPRESDKTGDSGGAKPVADIVPLDDHQLASRLSYLLWATMPDAELSALADDGKLRDPAVLAAQARRLLADPRSRALFDGFGAQWLGLDKLAGKTFDPEKFPQMTPELRTAMYEEVRLLFESIVRENLSLETFIESDHAFLNEELAAVYDLQGKVVGPQMRKVSLADANRGGILTTPGILAVSSFPNRTSPVNRGLWVLEQVLGEHVPPPPANVPPLENQDKAKIATMTLRQRTEMHRANPACASCHSTLDPIGFGLENFDAIGRWRDKDDTGGAIDATGELPDGSRFATPTQLKRIIAGRRDDVCRNLIGKLLEYALGRQSGGYDEIVIDKIAKAVGADEYRMQTLVVGVVTSYPFTHRRLSTPGDASRGK